jgi:hypothetical protein
MTMQQPQQRQYVSIPPAEYPMVNRAITNALFSESSTAPGLPPREDPVTWMCNQPHPLVPQMKVIRMFYIRGVGLEIYSLPDSEQSQIPPMRNFVPTHWVRFVEEIMPAEIFVEELAYSEAGGDDDPDPDPDPDALGDPGDPGGATDPQQGGADDPSFGSALT